MRGLFLAAIFGLLLNQQVHASSLTTIASVVCAGLPTATSDRETLASGGASASCSNVFDNGQGTAEDASQSMADVFGLHSLSTANFVRTEPSGNMRGASATGTVDFIDVWLATGGSGSATMVIPWVLSGGLVAVNGAGAQVTSSISAGLAGSTLTHSCELAAEGTCSVRVPFSFGQSIAVDGSLITTVQALGDNNLLLQRSIATADFSDTATVGPVSFFDPDGNQLLGVSLMDDSGHVIPTAGTPEPISISLILIGCAVLGLRGRIRSLVSLPRR